jgi:hypothetical protein
MKKLLYLSCLFMSLFMQRAFSQSGLTGINYQAVARNTNGTVLANQHLSVRFTIHGGSASGPVQYQESHDATTNTIGLFTLKLGLGSPLTGTFSTVPWGNANQYLQVEVNTGGGYSDLGTSQLMSVPFALFAANSTTGPAGPTGATGATGATGPIGATGATGAKGDPGPAGAKGDIGLTGPAGIQGLTGPAGAKGDAGATGAPGPIGPKGDIGLTGPIGVKGDAGPTGAPGPIGPKGDIGLTGPAGVKGDAGPTGAPGPIGPKGDIGLTGPAGVKGDAGPTGAPGPIGPKGDIGLTGPAGVKGDAGPTGAPGPKGDIGLTGAQGIQGVQGPLGPAGLPGLPGAVGPQGPIGPAGPAGSIAGAPAGGELAGTYPNPTIANGVITTAKLAPGVIPTTLPPNGPAGGDLNGTYPNPTVKGLQGRAVNAAAPAANDVLKYNGVDWAPGTVAGAFALPFVANENNAATLFAINNDGDGTSVEGVNNSTTSSIAAVRGIVSNATPGGFSSAVRGINNGTGGLGIGVWGSQAGSGWGVYGVTSSGLGVYGNSSAGGYGLFGNSNNGIGIYGTSNNGTPGNFVINNNANNSNVINAGTLGNGSILFGAASGTGNAIDVTSDGGSGVLASTNVQTAAGVLADNNAAGEAVVGRTTSDIAGAVVGRNDGGGYGVHGFIGTDVTGTGIGVFGRVGVSGSKGRAARFENNNADNTAPAAVEVYTNSKGDPGDIRAGSGLAVEVDNTNSVSAGVRSKVNTIFGNFGAAAFFGESAGTGGYAGLFYSSNTNSNSNTVVSINEGNGGPSSPIPRKMGMA